MRFLAMQENGYGVGLAQDQFPSDASAAMMATIDNMDSKNNAVVEEGSVISNLPLLFANGYPTSLEKITLAQLERFVTFMVQCSLGQGTTDLITKPQWWPKEVKFSNPLTRPKRVNENWMANLKKLVFRCYTYHRSEYLLRFCSYLARYPHEELEYVNNWDSTTSLYHKSTGKLLVTFRNENMNYDKRNESPRKKLLTHNGGSSSNKSKQLHSLVMVEPPSDDIYLCDNCDAEFVGLEKMKEHERICCEQEQTGNNSRPATPELSSIEPELRQDQFLEYFCLRSQETPAKSSPTDDNVLSNSHTSEVRRTSRRVRGGINFTRCQSIPFSSPAGTLLAKKSKMMTEEILKERLERIERHAIAPVLNESSRPKWMNGESDRDKWIVTHKPSREKPVDDYVHEYKFVNSVKKKPMLSIQSQLMYIVCRPVYVLLTRLTQEQIDELKRNPSKYRCPIRKISVNNNELVRRKKTTLSVGTSSKRKAPGDEDYSSKTEERCAVDTDATVVTEALNVHDVAKPTIEVTHPVNQAIPVSDKKETTAHEITVISLCSSDEEEEQDPLVSMIPDENTEPLQSMDTELNTKSFIRKLNPTELCTKPCIYPANSTNNWLSANILTDDAENCANKYRSTVMLNACNHLSPILRPAP